MSSFRPMLGHLLVSVVFVDGPAGTSAAFSTDEKNDALREIFAATGVLRRLGETWGASRPIPVRHVCGFTVVNRTVALSRDPAPLAATPPEIFDVRDRVWLEDVLAAMGFPDGTFSERVQRLRQGLVTLTIQGLGVADAIPVFVTKYPCHHLAHCASHAVVVSWPGVVDMYPENIDGVFAHEVGHVFDAPDEYGHCTASEAAGFFDTPNDNCTFLSAGVINPAPRPLCLMDHNNHALCPQTPLHWGWTDDDNDGICDLTAPATIQLPERAVSPGQQLVINGRNVWDARVVAFGDSVDGVVGDILVASRDSISVVVPATVSGIVTVSLVTRSGQDVSSFSDTWVLVAPQTVPTGIVTPMIFGVVPQSVSVGSKVTLLGANLISPLSVTFGDQPADLSGLEPFAEGFGEELEVPVPPGSGTVAVTVTTPAGTSPPFPPFSEFTYA